MTKRFNLDNMETYFKNYIPCDKHRQYPISNFCKQQKCLKFLCPQCVELHSKQFQGHYIQSIKSCVARASRKLKTTINQLETQIHKYNIHGFKNVEQYTQQVINSVRALKSQIIQEVNHYFQEHQKLIRSQIKNQWKNYDDLIASSQNMHVAVQELELLHNNLFLTSHTLQATKKVSMIDFKSLTEHFKRKNEALKNFSNAKFNVSIDSSKFKELKQTLQNILFINNKQPKINSAVQISREERVIEYQPTKPQKKYKASEINNDNQKKQLILYPGVINNSPHMDTGCLDITIGNSFIKNPFLHFFETQNRNLHVALLDELENSQSIWKTIKLTIKFEIPIFHKSIALRNGSIYLIGGSWGDKKLTKIFKFENQLNSLTQVGNMQYPRSSFAISNVGDKIYIVGGLSDKGDTLNKCQVFDTITFKTYRIADVKYGTTNSSLTTINNKYIIKVGGFEQDVNCHFIQRYSIQNDIWQQIDPSIQNLQIEFSLLSTSGSIQINQNQIFIFGGYNEQNTNQASDLSYIIDWSNGDYCIRDINLKPLPIAEGFWNSTPVIYNKKLYCLQNVADPESNNCLQDKRNILIFNGRIWKVHEM